MSDYTPAEGFYLEARDSDDLSVVHERCGQEICTAEAGDSLVALLYTAAQHDCGQEHTS